MSNTSTSTEYELPTIGSRFVCSLPRDPVKENYSRQIRDALYSIVSPTPVSSPRMLLWSRELGKSLGLSEDFARSEHAAVLMSGNSLFPGVAPFATRYGGHQFGRWAGQLGDGRAINLGELPTHTGDLLNLQLKGAGSTPYSRGADGRAVLRSSVREFLCSEGMFYLGIPTTRALSLVLTGDSVVRDMFYDGNPQAEPGAIVCRVAPGFTRFGHFQLCTYLGEVSLLRQLINNTIDTDFPHLRAQEADEKLSEPEFVLRWFEEVCRRTGEMLIGWMRVGFVHGVMNTDNMSILGLTIDYGPYGWIDHYDPDWTPNTTDAETRRYRFGQQADIGLWNLYQLANALLPVIENPALLEKILGDYKNTYENAWSSMMAQKLGLKAFVAASDKTLIDELLQLLVAREIDMTIFFRKLAEYNPDDKETSMLNVVEDSFYGSLQLQQEFKLQFETWEQRYAARLQEDGQDPASRREQMNRVNPWFILRNYLVQEAIDRAEAGDYAGLHDLYEALQNPYLEQPRFAHFFKKRPEWARHRAGASMLSCSS